MILGLEEETHEMSLEHPVMSKIKEMLDGRQVSIISACLAYILFILVIAS